MRRGELAGHLPTAMQTLWFDIGFFRRESIRRLGWGAAGEKPWLTFPYLPEKQFTAAAGTLGSCNISREHPSVGRAVHFTTPPTARARSDLLSCSSKWLEVCATRKRLLYRCRTHASWGSVLLRKPHKTHSEVRTALTRLTSGTADCPTKTHTWGKTQPVGCPQGHATQQQDTKACSESEEVQSQHTAAKSKGFAAAAHAHIRHRRAMDRAPATAKKPPP